MKVEMLPNTLTIENLGPLDQIMVTLPGGRVVLIHTALGNLAVDVYQSEKAPTQELRVIAYRNPQEPLGLVTDELLANVRPYGA